MEMSTPAARVGFDYPVVIVSACPRCRQVFATGALDVELIWGPSEPVIAVPCHTACTLPGDIRWPFRDRSVAWPGFGDPNYASIPVVFTAPAAAPAYIQLSLVGKNAWIGMDPETRFPAVFTLADILNGEPLLWPRNEVVDLFVSITRDECIFLHLGGAVLRGPYSEMPTVNLAPPEGEAAPPGWAIHQRKAPYRFGVGRKAS